MDFNLPKQSEVNKFIAKSKFSNFATINSKIKQSFTDKIQKITWRYKLAESTINVSGNESTEEIQIFEIELKEKEIPKNVLGVIDKSIPYPILYVFKYQNDIAYGITLKNEGLKRYYFSDWNEVLNFDFVGTNLEQVYQKLVRVFIEKEVKTEHSFENLVSLDIQKEKLHRDISALENKVKNEKQFKKQVEIHKQLKEKKKELESL